MQKSSKPSVLGMFAGAVETQHVFGLEEQIEELQAEITRLKKQQVNDQLAEVERERLNQTIEELREQLKATGVFQIHYSQIQPNPKQARQTFTPESIHSMGVSLREEGQQQPIILLPGNIIFDGERRWRSIAEYLQPEIEMLDAVRLPKELSESELHARTLLTSLHREGLNDLDLAEGLVCQAKLTLGIEPEEAIRAVRRAIARLNTKKLLPKLTALVSATRKQQAEQIENFDLDDIERSIFLLLLRFQQNPASVDANVFPCLKFAPDLKSAIRQHGLGANHARILQQLSSKNLKVEDIVAEQIRQNATKQVLQERLTIAQTRSLVTNIIAEHSSEENTKPSPQINSLIRKVSAIQVERVEQQQLADLLSVLEAKRKEIMEKLANPGQLSDLD